MTDGLLEFGDIFEYEGNEYIFLASKTDITYAAKILGTELSIQLSKQCLKLVTRNVRIERPLYCFVILTTEELKDRAAHFGNPEINPQIFFNKQSISLNDKDLNNLKQEIEKSRATPLGLRTIISNLQIQRRQ